MKHHESSVSLCYAPAAHGYEWTDSRARDRRERQRRQRRPVGHVALLRPLDAVGERQVEGVEPAAAAAAAAAAERTAETTQRVLFLA